MPSLAVVIPQRSFVTPEASRRPSMANSISSVRRASQAIISDAPMTPPLSPGHSEQGADAIVVDAEPRYSGPERNIPHSEASITVIAARSETMAMDRPLRLLEDEQVHLQRSGLKLSDFEVRGTLGTGTFARVLLVRHRTSASQPGTQNHFAMKVLRKTEIVRLRQVEHVNAERYILSRVTHPFVVDLFATFQDSLNVYMLMSYVPGGELFTHLRRARRFTPDVTRFYLATIILALKYLHSFNIIYRDLKPENLLLDARGYLRLTDFGFAKIVDDRTWTLCGTPEYLAPEIIQSDGHGKAADWWACDILDHPWFRGVDWDALERREINAPIIPHTSSVDDTRHFLHLPLPPQDEMPGLIKEEQPLALHQRFDPIAYQFLEF
ncbi:cAMP dependent protein kinase [Lyophyllum atratum]|nr:cAMP dependent protein kinase [Lyophyllum atratum]